jgi:hypothetical protein
MIAWDSLCSQSTIHIHMLNQNDKCSHDFSPQTYSRAGAKSFGDKLGRSLTFKPGIKYHVMLELFMKRQCIVVFSGEGTCTEERTGNAGNVESISTQSCFDLRFQEGRGQS